MRHSIRGSHPASKGSFTFTPETETKQVSWQRRPSMPQRGHRMPSALCCITNSFIWNSNSNLTSMPSYSKWARSTSWSTRAPASRPIYFRMRILMETSWLGATTSRMRIKSNRGSKMCLFSGWKVTSCISKMIRLTSRPSTWAEARSAPSLGAILPFTTAKWAWTKLNRTSKLRRITK